MRIDAVIAWVDGADPAHRAARARLAGRSDDGGDARFVQSGEIYVALASILKHAPFVDRIHVVTDGQRPEHLDAFFSEGLSAPDRIALVDHDAIFSGLPAARPTFSSRTIEAAIHRIPGLAEHFVYLNDDMSFTRPATQSDLFHGGVPRIAGTRTAFSESRTLPRVKTAIRRLLRRPDLRPSHLVAQETGARLAGAVGSFVRVQHRPHPLRRSTIEAALAANPGLLEGQVSHHFRDRSQYLPVAFANHAELSAGAVAEPPASVAYLRAGKNFDATLARIANGDAAFACVQGLESFSDDHRRAVYATFLDTLGSHLPAPVRAAFAAV